MGGVDTRRLARDDEGGESSEAVGPGGQGADGEGGRPRVMLAHVEVAVAMEFDDPRQARREVGRELVVVDRLGRWARRACASRRRRAAGRSRTRRSRRRSPGPGSRPRAAASRRTSSALDCAQPTWRTSSPRLWTVSRRCRKTAPARAVPTPGKRQAQGTGRRSESSSWAPAAAARGSVSSAATSAAAAPGRSSESSLSSRQYRPRASRIRVESFSALPVRRSRAIRRMSPAEGAHRVGGAVVGGVVEDQDLVLDAGRVGGLDRAQAGEQVARGRSCSRRSRKAWAPRAPR